MISGFRTLQLSLHKIVEALPDLEPERPNWCTKGFFVGSFHFCARTSLQTDALGGLRSLGRPNKYQTLTFYG
jgi:hypothetical protein